MYVTCWKLPEKRSYLPVTEQEKTLIMIAMLTLSIVKSVELIGEAASRISKECRDTHPEIPWNDIVAMRNRLIHVYFDIDLDRVWDTVTDDLPPLISALEKIIVYEE